ncbi:hypothetical protein Back11_11170 [Paenibacillus baekrokdamisoli]|uniref:Uncharacterized protein n=1 Tax=Paenibacillus baekrokdamisoli TaxID=1712516 RepID=A0A3G9ING5_9BACL|nr:hypothetical protein [Paenibacillus baekrokdamisoli]MBB3067038.1 hypothetical protein [Paenibacillus baekrokdamisoli]BBH19772.1 hypothetical protein Back11_11170 [Paenibacillus baekrokdamisoli]
MAGKVWFWSRKHLGLQSLSPQAWRDGIPESTDTVIVCDNYALPPAWRDLGEPLVLNAGASTFSLWSWAEVSLRLKRSGVAVMEPVQVPSTYRIYKISLFHLQMIHVERIQTLDKRLIAMVDHREPSSNTPDYNLRFSGDRACLEGSSTQSSSIAAPKLGYLRQQELSDILSRRMTRLALKSMHAVGLDFGSVVVHVEDNGRCTVASMQVPRASELQEGIWQEAIQKFAANWSDPLLSSGTDSSVKPLLIGADPEFLLLSKQGKVVSAEKYLEGGHGAGCDAVLVGGRVIYPVAELRPAPADSPDALASNIRRLLIQANARITDHSLRWAAGGMPVPGFALGGHIHLSGVRLTSRLLRQLDSYVALPLAMLEAPNDQARRPRYGTLGDFRYQPHGGFEYRTLASWLVSPVAAKGAFALMLLCARETDHLHYRPSENEALVDAYYTGDRETLKGCLDRLSDSISATSSYKELSQWIDPLILAAREGRTWNVDQDIRVKWRICAQE